MTRATKALTIMLVAMVGIWGCAQGSNSGPAAAERIKTLETKCGKLENDFKAVAQARDQLRKKLAEVEQERATLQQEAAKAQLLAEDHKDLVKNHADLRQQFNTRTSERDALQGQMEALRKGMRTLLGQAEAALAPAASPGTVEAMTTSNTKQS